MAQGMIAAISQAARTCEDEIEDLKSQLNRYKTLLKEKDNSLEDLENDYRKEVRSQQRLLKKAQDE